ncbi:hypothetical protein BC939DRAFT_125589 [Gamsiella multidivaricata]|uniref:uncharacterized protein n=1 Tax=Gamsiella multidivaricata TaxID=101098 RepID=UPI0022203A5E|nr:uncharacterized protein BC939DRAFT_125589 [Gamsiella multidivaricata]KAI7825741.1 hypothetical protein BC939DRAFT_125589 [Gamsiella multidivaricata]
MYMSFLTLFLSLSFFLSFLSISTPTSHTHTPLYTSNYTSAFSFSSLHPSNQACGTAYFRQSLLRTIPLCVLSTIYPASAPFLYCLLGYSRTLPTPVTPGLLFPFPCIPVASYQIHRYTIDPLTETQTTSSKLKYTCQNVTRTTKF